MNSGSRRESEAASCCGTPDRRSREELPADPEQIVDRVRERYGRIAGDARSGCCGSGSEEEAAHRIGYEGRELADVPAEATLGLGCGAPVGRLELKPGETVLDLGSGPGLDALLAARAVGPEGRVIGVDMTPEMIRRATTHAGDAGAKHVEFREGRLEDLPVSDGSVDAVTSNCVINLVPDKPAVFREIARVLRPGGRLVISDVMLDVDLPAALESDLLAYVGCVSGALRRERYLAGVEEAGMERIEVLADIDFLGATGDALPEELVTLIERSGVRTEELAGKVRSITFRAYKPA